MSPRKPPGIVVRTNSDGTKSYQVRWRQGGGRDGRRLSHTFDNQRAAIDARARIVAAGNVCRCPEHAPPGAAAEHPDGPTTFGEFARRHVASLTGVGAGYRARFLRDLERHLSPFLERPIDGVSELDVREWVRGMEEGAHPWLMRRVPGTEHDYKQTPLSAVTIRRLLVQAGSVVSAAQAEGLATRNPFKGHRLGRRDPDRHALMRTITPGEWAILEQELPAGVGRDFARVLVGTGLRFSEAAGLTVGAVDLLARPPRLHVRQAWKDDGAGGWELGPPKSVRSRRSVTFGPSVLDALAPHLAGKRDAELVFTGPKGGPVRPSNYYHRVWRPAVDRAVARGMSRRPRVHDLRHSYASWQLSAGVALLTVSRRLGHESAAVTSDIYGHVTMEAEDRAVDVVEAAMTSGPTGP